MMLKALCLTLGVMCWDGDRPPPVVETPALSVATIEAPVVADTALRAPEARPASMFDASCDVQPPDALKPHYWSAARRHPTGATSCELARQGQGGELIPR